MSRARSPKISCALKQAAREAAELYSDTPLDYRRRPVGPQTVLDAGEDPHFLEVVELVARHAPGKRLLDVGVAYGIYAIVLKRQFGFAVYGIEHPDNLEVYCRLPIREGIDVRACDLHRDEVPFADEQFDVVVSSEVIEHLLIPPNVVFSKLRRILRPGGKLIVTTPNFANLRNVVSLVRGRNPTGRFPEELAWTRGVATDLRVHPREYTVGEVRHALLKAGLEVSWLGTKMVRPQRKLSFPGKLVDLMMRICPTGRDSIVAVGTRPVGSKGPLPAEQNAFGASRG